MAEFVAGSPVKSDQPNVEVTITPNSSLSVGGHLFGLTVVDDAGNESQQTTFTVIVVDDEAPTAVLTGPSRVGFGKSFTLSGARSVDNPPGKITTFIFTLLDEVR